MSISKVKFINTSKRGSINSLYISTYQESISDADRGDGCGDSFFNRGSLNRTPTLKVETIYKSNSKNQQSILELEPNKSVIKKLKDLYKLNDDGSFTFHSRRAYIYFIRIIRLSTRYMGREIIKFALELNRTKKFNIYKAIELSSIYFRFKINKLNLNNMWNTLYIPNYSYNYTILNKGYFSNYNLLITRNTDSYVCIKRILNTKSQYLNLFLKSGLNRTMNAIEYVTCVNKKSKGLKNILNYAFYLRTKDQVNINERDFLKVKNNITQYDSIDFKDDIKSFNAFYKIYKTNISIFEKYAEIKLTNLNDIIE